MPLENIAEVILTPTGDVPDSVGTRSIPITRKEPLITVGRSSRNKTKNLQPSHNNAYFDSPVMSRLHSWIKCDEAGKVLISDAGSMHGTYLDDKLLEPKLFVPLETGSQVRFGSSVTRGPDVFPPKAFDVKVVQNSRMAEIQHGYGITSDELILPDSPYYSSEEEEDEEDEVMITKVNHINTVDLTSGSDHGSDWEEETAQNRVPGHWDESEWSERPKAKGWPASSWSDGPPSEQPITIVRESLRERVCIDLDPSSIIRDTHIVDLTAETPVQQQNKLPGARISIPDLLAQERQEQSRRSSQTPVRNRSFSGEDGGMSLVGGESNTQSVEDYDEDSMDEDSTSDPEPTSESAPTSPFSPESIKTSTNGLPALPSMQSPMPTLVNEIVPPEVQKAWNSTWTTAPYLSPFVYAGGTTSASDTMEQVRKAEAMRDRAQEFLRSRIEMQSSHSLQTPKELEHDSPTPKIPTDEGAAKPNPAIPLWIQNFVQGTKLESSEEASAENHRAGDLLAPTQGANVPECGSTRSETRSPSPVLKMAGNFQVSDDGNEEEDEEEEEKEEREQKERRPFYYDSDSILSETGEEGCSSPEFSVSDRYESEDMSDDEEEVLQVLGEYMSAEDDDYDEDDEDVDEALMDFVCDDQGHDTESNPSDDEIVEDHTKCVKTTTVQNPVKSAMSMENFFSPKDEEEVRSSQEDEIVKRWNAEIDDLFSTQPDLEIEEPKDAVDINMVDPDADLLPPASKKRKRSESEEIEECPHYAVASELEALEISTPRKIAPLPQRFLTRSGQNTSFAEVQSPREEAERKELLALASELKNELEAAEPGTKRPRVQNAGATWGSTIATAMAGALIGGVGVFAALVATAGDM
ncbi:uncharacterized protein DFL_005561 [Arthrobotrys flagrans]|uniref:FHA domain-containing protein n=1 Tax=Arthrobotrys flagrans TaxID=97331 RepID=A0A436ZXT0_ARTFL|nr:hypothetical protein DFL_005561 [Arthrobotrys flagrans]